MGLLHASSPTTLEIVRLEPRQQPDNGPPTSSPSGYPYPTSSPLVPGYNYSSNNTQSGPTPNAIVPIAISVGAICSVAGIAIVAYLVLKSCRGRRAAASASPSEKDGIVQRLGRRLSRRRGGYSNTLQPDNSTRNLVGRGSNVTIDRESQEMHTQSRDLEGQNGTGMEQDNRDQDGPAATVSSPLAGAGIDRNTSVRSVMTLPAYNPLPLPTEQLLGREGERAGIDTVLEYPETYNEEESRREEEMNSLYQIRAQRRQEQADREERRQARREARARGDQATLERLQAESRRRLQEGNVSQQMIAEHQNNAPGYRSRRISSVQYADIGVARHDGSRIRSESISGSFVNPDEDSRPLLEQTMSRQSLAISQHSHSRARSGSSARSVTSSTNSVLEDDSTTPNAMNRSRSHSPSTSIRTTATQPQLSLHIPTEEPPSYDDENITTAIARERWGDAPAYSSPVSVRRQPSSALPAIQITPFSPVSPITGSGSTHIVNVRRNGSGGSSRSAPVSAIER